MNTVNLLNKLFTSGKIDEAAKIIDQALLFLLYMYVYQDSIPL